MEIFHTSWKDLFKNTDITMHSSTSLGNAKVVKNCSLIFFFFNTNKKVLQKAYCNHMAAANLQSRRFVS